MGEVEKIIAEVLFELAEENGGQRIGTQAEVCSRLHERKQAGKEVPGITLQRVPIGFYSPEVASFLGKLFGQMGECIEFRRFEGNTLFFIPGKGKKNLREIISPQ